MRNRRGAWLLVASSLVSIGCFKGKSASEGADAAPPAGSGSSAASSTETAAPAPGSTDGDKDRDIRKFCESKCARECDDEQRDRPSFFDSKRAAIAASPFEVKIDRVFLKGSCHRGDAPEKRSDADGIAAVVEGSITYTGDDEIFRAHPAGGMYLRVSPDRYARVEVAEKAYSMWEGRREVSRFQRAVRGVDPWLKGQPREFHWESRAIDPGFCDVMPDEAAVVLEVNAFSIRGGSKTWPVRIVSLAWDEVAGMSVREKVTVRKQKGAGMVDEPAEVLYSRLDRVLANLSSGKAEWLNQSSLIHPTPFNKGPAVTFPAELKTPQWTVKVNGVSGVKESNGYTPTGEDQFLTIVDVELQYSAGSGDGGKEPKPVKVKAFSFQLETAPGVWQKPIAKANELNGDFDIAPGGKANGKLAFPRQRFERPFRLEVKTPDRSTLLVDVFSYALGPERWKK